MMRLLLLCMLMSLLLLSGCTMEMSFTYRIITTRLEEVVDYETPIDDIDYLYVETDRLTYSTNQRIEIIVHNATGSVLTFSDKTLGLDVKYDYHGRWRSYPASFRGDKDIVHLEPEDTKRLVIPGGLSNPGNYKISVRGLTNDTQITGQTEFIVKSD